MTFSSVPSRKSSRAILFAMLLGFAMSPMFAGCNQNRYQPAEWRAAPRSTTLPNDGDAVADSHTFLRGTTLPGRGTTLPSKSWTTLPQRESSRLPGTTTLPERYWLPDEMTTRPWRNGMTSLPSSNPTTLPNRPWPSGNQVSPGTTLPRSSPNPLRNR